MKTHNTLQKNYQHASDLFAHNHQAQALCCCKEILQQWPCHADTLHLMGDIAFEKQNFAQAAGYFQRALKKHEDKASDYFALAKTFIKMKKFKPAENAFLKAVQLAPGNIDILINLGNFMEGQHRIRAAAACFSRAITINPSLPELYLKLGTLQSILGEIQSAIFNFQVLCEMEPQNMRAKHMLAALEGKNTDAAPETYVKALFDPGSSAYDRHMLKGLDYRVPELMVNLLNTTDASHRKFDNALDLGCGTGLGGTVFKKKCNRLTGIDLAPKMVEISRQKSIYDALHVGNILELPSICNETFDLFIASDVLVYIGKLPPLFTAISQCIRPRTLFVFSTESLAGKGYKLQASGRYAHSRQYIKTIANTYGFECKAIKAECIRKERGKEMEGDIWILIFNEDLPGEFGHHTGCFFNA
ncbi:methyltransferase domain-containing protein [Desulfocicer niacini]